MITHMSSSPLKGKHILLTRAEHQLASLSREVCSRGAVAIDFPCLGLELLSHAVEEGARSLQVCSDVLFTSTNGVLSLDAFCRENSQELKALLTGKRIAAVGEQTAAALAELGIHVDIVPALASQEGLVNAYATHGLPTRLLFFRAEEGSNRLAEALQKQGISVETIAAYRTVCPAKDATEIIAMLKASRIDAVLLGSTKAVRFYLQRIGSIELANLPAVVVISAQMAEAAEKLGLRVQVVAKNASFESMLDTLAEYFDANRS
ncbi:uroporphyrinogen-III synthase/uroporphyrinogen III methyltransferase [Mariprofundus aestuarium]|uniref:Uroporphyrinogen-III synthase n=2 Tax=Mariprofundus aestuarium TaxID=1921086 RepID=A0A2K8KV68_MARES|nr:uroporphyrinogen-III synthase/uroporphyrinogen III methyltransferase [Mariprofundus aestuarium]